MEGCERPDQTAGLVNCSALEIARQAGWDDSVSEIETRVRTALATLEQSGYLERGDNIPHVYATGITVKNMDEARQRLSASVLFGNDEMDKAVRIIKSLISQKYIKNAQGAEAESRIDYLADILGLTKREVVSVVERMRQEGILADSKDITAYLLDSGTTERRSQILLERFARLERYILNRITGETLRISCKQLNDDAVNQGITTSKEKDIRTILYFLALMRYIRKNEDVKHNLEIELSAGSDNILSRFERRIDICRFVVEYLYGLASTSESEKTIQFSVVEIQKIIKSGSQNLFGGFDALRLEDVEEALLDLSKIGALKLDGGFLVLYNAMNIRRIKDTKIRYKREDYRMLDEFYKLRLQQIHIVGEYASMMVKDYNAALEYVHDYFHMDYRKFISKYFKGERLTEIQHNLTPRKYRQIFGELSRRQMEIIADHRSRCIVVAAGPGSGKTRVLVHKLASLLLLEDVKHEQLLMLTFSRAAATEFKQRLMELVGNAAHFVEIKTFHSYCFDLMGRIGNLDDAQNVVAEAAGMISRGEVEPNRIGKTVLVIDEAQDMGSDEFDLVQSLMHNNEDMRVIAVGDDDQNIFEFRGSDSKYMYLLSGEEGAAVMEMTENYRSAHSPVAFANSLSKRIRGRLKTAPIVSMSKESGRVELIRCHSRYLYQPLVDRLTGNSGGQSVCVLTQTNEEAAIVNALLQKRGIKAKLIQSMQGLRFWNIAEMRYFMKYIDKRINSQQITDELWREAAEKTLSVYHGSSGLMYVRNCIRQFERISRAKYLSDFKEYVFESSIEDFCDVSGSDVVVSTIHKAKGREFDDVYMLIAADGVVGADKIRRYYVGATRAKKRLYIYTDGAFFSGLHAEASWEDHTPYSLPEEVVLQLSHKDVYLDFFKNRKREILALRGGDTLRYDNQILYNPQTGSPVAKLSMKMLDTLSQWERKGYKVKSAGVRFIVAWKPKDAPKGTPETAVVLADLCLTQSR